MEMSNFKAHISSIFSIVCSRKNHDTQTIIQLFILKTRVVLVLQQTRTYDVQIMLGVVVLKSKLQKQKKGGERERL